MLIDDITIKIKAGDLSINIIHPLENIAGQNPKNTNDSSIVSKMVFGKNSFLFTGDSPMAIEKYLVDIYGNNLKTFFFQFSQKS